MQAIEQINPTRFTPPQEIVINPSSSHPAIAVLNQTLVVGFDIETKGLIPHEGFIRLYQLYIPSIDTVLIWDSKAIGFNRSFQICLKVLANNAVEKRIHNSLFEYGWIREKHDIRLENVLDTQVLNQLDKAGLAMALKNLLTPYAQQMRNDDYVEIEVEEDEDLPKSKRGKTKQKKEKKKVINPNSLSGLSIFYKMGLDKKYQSYNYGNFDPIPQEVYEYAASDAKATWYLGEIIPRPKQDIDLLMTPIFGELNHVGFPVNLDKLKKIASAYLIEAERVKKYVMTEIGVNPASWKQVLDWVLKTFPDKKPPIAWNRKEKCFKPSSNKPALNKFIADNPDIDSYWLRQIQAQRSINTSAKFPEKYINLYRDGRVRGRYSIMAFQGEGRSSCKEENMQNVPKLTRYLEAANLPPIRSVFEAEEGFHFIEIDLSGAHSQIARWFSKDENLIKSRNTGLKMHYFTLEKMFAQQGVIISPEEIKKAHKDPAHPMHNEVKKRYKLSKNVFYSYLNFSGAKTLQNTFLNEDEIVTIQTCQDYLDVTAATFWGLRKFQERILNLIQDRYQHMRSPIGYLGRVSYLNIPDGSIIHFVEDYAQISKQIAAIWLRTEATAIKKALLEIYNLIKLDEDWQEVEIVNFSHDSFVLHVPDEVLEIVGDRAQEILIRNMTQYVKDYDHEMEYKFNGKYVGYEVKKNWS